MGIFIPLSAGRTGKAARAHPGPGADGYRGCEEEEVPWSREEEREEPQGSALEPDFPTGRVGGSEEKKGERV